MSRVNGEGQRVASPDVSSTYKAFEVRQLRRCPDWEAVAPSGDLADSDIVYVRDDCRVARSPFDERPDGVPDPPESWKQFCREALDLEGRSS
jgi:hypothetical protein